MDLNETELLWLGTAGLLMDIGWTKLPLDLFENISIYTEAEYSLIQKHVDYSVEILEKSGFEPEVVDLVVKHHERVDGSGYYAGYVGEEISLSSRILSLIDYYNSKINGYYNSPSAIPSTALQEVYQKAQKGSYDVELVELLIKMVGIYPVSSAVQLNTLEKGVVLKVNWRDALKPMITIYYNKNGLPLMKPMIIDLNKQLETQTQRSIKSVIDPRNPKHDPENLLVFAV